MLRASTAFLLRFILSAGVLMAAVWLASPGNPNNTLAQALVLSVVLSIAWYITLAKFLWFLLVPWLLYVLFWLGAVMGTYGLGLFQALLVAIGLAILSALVDEGLGVKTFRRA